MGYASTIPSGIASSQTGGAAATFITLTTLEANYGMNSFSTLNYKQPLSYAFGELIIDGAKDKIGRAHV